jgi:hypothetical protein
MFPQARRLLKTLLVSPLRLETVQNGDRWKYRILGAGSYLPLLENPAEPLLPSVWCPQGDPSYKGALTEAFFTFKIDLLVEAA